MLQEALAVLASEVVPDSQPAGTTPEYRVSITQTLLYRVSQQAVNTPSSYMDLNSAGAACWKVA